ncbi:MAG: NAD(P)H-dependent oxidoreductase [Caulobacter sp.]|nr:NAD(P)H-dependent oxidoreductase [Vitreoscilla sp.]
MPAALKAWFDHIVCKGRTLGLDGKGLLEGRKATVRPRRREHEREWILRLRAG